MRVSTLFCVLFFLLFISPAAAQRVTLSGTVMRSDTSLPVIGASLFVVQTGAGTVTDEEGRFSLSLPPGVYDIELSSVGYRRDREHIVVNQNRTVVFRLVSKTFELDEIQVRDRREDQNVRDVTMGLVQLDIRQLKKMPVVLGEPDILKVVTLQAGVSTAGEGAGGFNVRGGRTDQNLVLLDGAPLFNTSHLLGFYANVNADVVQEADLYKGTFPAQYGGRTASLLLINTRSGNREAWRLSGGVGPLSSRLVADGPITKNLTLLVGGRVAYPNYLLRAFPERSAARQSRAFFYDGTLRLQYTPNSQNTLSLTAYRSDDDFKFPGDTLYGWQSDVLSARWSSLLTPRLQFNLQALYSGYAFQVEGIRTFQEFWLQSYIRHREAKADVFYTVNDKLKVQAGANGILYQIQKGDVKSVGDQSTVNSQTLQPEYGREAGAYVQSEWKPRPYLTLQVGLRYSLFAQTGPFWLNRYESGLPRSPETLIDSAQISGNQVIQRYGGWEPRLGLRLQLAPSTAVKLNYSRMRQYVHLISNTTAITPVDFWKLSDPFVPGQVADQVSAGIFQNMKENTYELSVEGYYKTLQNLVEYRNGATLLLNPRLETDLLPAEGRAYGIELNLNKTKGRLTGQLSYSFARSLVAVQTPFSELQINDGNWFPSNFDRPHNLYVQTRLDLRNNWTFSTNFVYSTGIPATYPDGRYVFEEQPVVDFSRRNLDRVPDYHRLDVSFSKDTRVSRSQRRYSIWTFGIYNLYARRNPYSIFFTRTFQRTASYRLSVFGTLIPSLTYNFYF